MASNFNKAERYVKQGDEYKLLSYATSSESVEMADGTDLETKMDNIEEEIDTKIDSVKIGTTEYKSGTTVTLPVYTKNEADSTFGADIALTIDTSTYKMTLELKDNKGQILSSKEIDFPIESMVVNASYANGTLTLTLQNGNDINVDISSIISGLVPDTRTIAGVDLKDNITATELRTALNVASGANNYTHPDSGVTAGTYRSVTVNKQGHVTAGSNPTVTIAQGGTGATDATTARGNLGITPANIGALSTSGDSKSNTVTFTSSDVADGSATSWTSVSALTSGITHATFFARVSQMFKNVRYLYKMLGTTDISSVGDGTVKGAISTLNSNLGNYLPLDGGTINNAISGINGGFFETDGNVYLKAGGYSDWLSNILIELSGSVQSTALTNSANGVITLGKKVKIVYGSYPANYMTHDAGRGGYFADINLSSYGFKNYMFAQATPLYPIGMPKAVVFSVSTTTLSIGCDVNVADCHVHWMVIGSI